jgi:hypothetical protein
VYPTVHARDGARVDFYRMITGPTRAETVEDPKHPGELRRVLLVQALHELCTCRDCWASPAARGELERLWKEGA